MKRRNFLKMTAVGASAMAIARSAAQAQEATKKAPTYRVAIIGRTGKGDYGHNLGVAWKGIDRAQIVAVADEDEAGRAKAAEQLGITKTYADYREMLAKEKPQIVTIAVSWPDCHLEMAKACAEAGCHVLLEKPMCRS
ncbi:MAG: Gfo/Idh/MocA family oxidoreductase, partial [Phycisphaerae bacterium]|nr:Gfo/Idh/MocA family oxidoreductase [Phycisphaerae bacterium]